MNIFNWKYRYFKKKLKGVGCMILDMEFKRFKTAEIREEIRKELSNKKAGLEAMIEQVKVQSGQDTSFIEQNIEQQKQVQRDIERHVEQLKTLDLEINGGPKTADYPDGVQGLNQQIDALHELKGMIKNYIKNEL